MQTERQTDTQRFLLLLERRKFSAPSPEAFNYYRINCFEAQKIVFGPALIFLQFFFYKNCFIKHNEYKHLSKKTLLFDFLSSERQKMVSETETLCTRKLKYFCFYKSDTYFLIQSLFLINFFGSM